MAKCQKTSSVSLETKWLIHGLQWASITSCFCSTSSSSFYFGAFRLSKWNKTTCNGAVLPSFTSVTCLYNFLYLTNSKFEPCLPMMPLCFPWARKGKRRESSFWRGLITKSWKLIGCSVRLNAWRQIVTNVRCCSVDRWRDADCNERMIKDFQMGLPIPPLSLSCSVIHTNVMV